MSVFDRILNAVKRISKIIKSKKQFLPHGKSTPLFHAIKPVYINLCIFCLYFRSVQRYESRTTKIFSHPLSVPSCRTIDRANFPRGVAETRPLKTELICFVGNQAENMVLYWRRISARFANS